MIFGCSVILLFVAPSIISAACNQPGSGNYNMSRYGYYSWQSTRINQRQTYGLGLKNTGSNSWVGSSSPTGNQVQTKLIYYLKRLGSYGGTLKTGYATESSFSVFGGNTLAFGSPQSVCNYDSSKCYIQKDSLGTSNKSGNCPNSFSTILPTSTIPAGGVWNPGETFSWQPGSESDLRFHSQLYYIELKDSQLRQYPSSLDLYDFYNTNASLQTVVVPEEGLSVGDCLTYAGYTATNPRGGKGAVCGKPLPNITVLWTHPNGDREIFGLNTKDNGNGPFSITIKSGTSLGLIFTDSDIQSYSNSDEYGNEDTRFYFSYKQGSSNRMEDPYSYDSNHPYGSQGTSWDYVSYTYPASGGITSSGYYEFYAQVKDVPGNISRRQVIKLNITVSGTPPTVSTTTTTVTTKPITTTTTPSGEPACYWKDANGNPQTDTDITVPYGSSFNLEYTVNGNTNRITDFGGNNLALPSPGSWQYYKTITNVTNTSYTGGNSYTFTAYGSSSYPFGRDCNIRWRAAPSTTTTTVSQPYTITISKTESGNDGIGHTWDFNIYKCSASGCSSFSPASPVRTASIYLSASENYKTVNVDVSGYGAGTYRIFETNGYAGWEPSSTTVDATLTTSIRSRTASFTNSYGNYQLSVSTRGPSGIITRVPISVEPWGTRETGFNYPDIPSSTKTTATFVAPEFITQVSGNVYENYNPEGTSHLRFDHWECSNVEGGACPPNSTNYWITARPSISGTLGSLTAVYNNQESLTVSLSLTNNPGPGWNSNTHTYTFSSTDEQAIFNFRGVINHNLLPGHFPDASKSKWELDGVSIPISDLDSLTPEMLKEYGDPAKPEVHVLKLIVRTNTGLGPTSDPSFTINIVPSPRLICAIPSQPLSVIEGNELTLPLIAGTEYGVSYTRGDVFWKIDWGDGTYSSEIANMTTLPNSHRYSSIGNKVIKLDPIRTVPSNPLIIDGFSCSVNVSVKPETDENRTDVAPH